MSLFFQFIVFSCFVVASYAKTEAEVKAWFVTQGLECNKDYHVSPDELHLLQKHKMPNSKNAKCLMACVYRKAKWLDSKGMFDEASANAMIEREYSNASKKENSKKLFEMCNKVNEESVNDGESGCERSALLFKCLTENAPKMGFQV